MSYLNHRNTDIAKFRNFRIRDYAVWIRRKIGYTSKVSTAAAITVFVV